MEGETAKHYCIDYTLAHVVFLQTPTLSSSESPHVFFYSHKQSSLDDKIGRAHV